jgi:hypothetical protein
VRDAAGKEQVFTIAPSGLMPYGVGLTDDLEKALFLRRFDVPFWALSYVFGRDEQDWYRLENHFGRYNLVQTVVKNPENLPKHLLADEKVTWLNGEKVGIATTVGEDCVLGASVALGLDTPTLPKLTNPSRRKHDNLTRPISQRRSIRTAGKPPKKSGRSTMR